MFSTLTPSRFEDAAANGQLRAPLQVSDTLQVPSWRRHSPHRINTIRSTHTSLQLRSTKAPCPHARVYRPSSTKEARALLSGSHPCSRGRLMPSPKEDASRSRYRYVSHPYLCSIVLTFPCLPSRITTIIHRAVVVQALRTGKLRETTSPRQRRSR